MKQLVKPIRQKETRTNPIARQKPLVDDGRVVVAKTAKQKEAPAQKEKTDEPKRKKIGAKQLFTALTFVMMMSALISQASVLVGCAKTAVETLQKSIPTVTVDSSTTHDEKLNNESYGGAGGMAPLPIKPDAAVKSAPENKDWRSNESYR